MLSLMKFFVAAAITLFTFQGLVSHAQDQAATGQEPAAAFRASVLDRQLYLRDFNADDDIKARWIDGHLEVPAPSARSLAIFSADKVETRSDSIQLSGRRFIVFRRNASELGISPYGEPVHIRVDLDKTDLASLLPRLKDALFFPSGSAALAALPTRFKFSLPSCIDRKACPLEPRSPDTACDCADLSANGCHATEITSTMQGVKPPKVTHEVDPSFSDKARQAKFAGSVEIGLVVDTKGESGDFWVVRSPGLALEAKALAAIREYRFSPATCRGKPISFPLFIDINFRSF